MSDEEFRMPFGKHKGKTLDEVPASYIDWLAGKDDLFPETREALEAYMAEPWFQLELDSEKDRRRDERD